MPSPYNAFIIFLTWVILSFLLAHCLFGEHLQRASPVPGTVHELQERPSLLSANTRDRMQSLENYRPWVLSCQKPENVCPVLKLHFLVMPLRIHLRNVVPPPHPTGSSSSARGIAGGLCTSLAWLQRAVAFPPFVVTAKGSLVPGSETHMEHDPRRTYPMACLWRMGGW